MFLVAAVTASTFKILLKQESAKKDEMMKLELKSKPEDDKSAVMCGISVCCCDHKTLRATAFSTYAELPTNFYVRGIP